MTSSAILCHNFLNNCDINNSPAMVITPSPIVTRYLLHPDAASYNIPFFGGG